MKHIWAVLKKELRSYFVSPIVYVFGASFLVIFGFLASLQMIRYSMVSWQTQSNPAMLNYLNINELLIAPLFSNASIAFIFFVPLLTMRLFAEEKKTGTIELLLSYPLRDVEAVLGKFGACFGIYVMIVALTLFHILMVILFHGNPELLPLIAGYTGLILMGAAFISFGVFASSLTENQIVAAVITFAGIFLSWGFEWLSTITGGLVGDILNHLALHLHLQNFARGIIEVKGVVYYLSVTFFFLFLTLQSLESKRWRS
jgi:ABC-2 type transport system permease protein